MKFGIFLLLQSPDMRPSQETYDHALEQGVLADQLGGTVRATVRQGKVSIQLPARSAVILKPE